jgi:hypothetical protein
MPVSVIFENLEAGANVDDIMNWFEGLDRNQVKPLSNLLPAVLTKLLRLPAADAGSLTRVLPFLSVPSLKNIRSKQPRKEGGTRSRTVNC